jgi:hypothetical protein
VEKGYEGFVAFISKTKLMRHYEDTLGAHFIGAQRMAIGREATAKSEPLGNIIKTLLNRSG